MGPLTGALISGGASLVSGLLQPKKSQSAAQKSIAKSNIKRVIVKNKQEEAWNKQVQARADAAAKLPIVTRTTTTGGFDVAGFHKAAEASGFNPVTFLQAGGLQAFSSTRTVNSVTGSERMQAALVGLDKPGYEFYQRETGAPQSSGMSIGEAVGGALQAGANSYLAVRQQIDQNEFQRSLVMAQLQAANQAGTGRTRGGGSYSLGGVPSMASSAATIHSNGGSGSGSGSGSSRIGSTTTIDSTMGRLTNPNFISDEDWTNALGETAGPVMKVVTEIPGMVMDPRNEPFAKKMIDEYSKGAEHFGGFLWDNYARPTVHITPGSAADRITNFDYGTWYRPTTARSSRLHPNP